MYNNSIRIKSNIHGKSNALIILIASLGGFWGIFNGLFVNLIINICIIIFPVLFIQYKSKSGKLFTSWQDTFITLFVLCLMLNFVVCRINRGQSFLDSFLVTEVKNMFLLLFFYLLIKIKCSIYELERCIVILYFIFIVCFFLQYIVFFPNPVFQMIGVNSDELNSVDTQHRFRMIAQTIGFFGYFFLLNRVLVEKKSPVMYYLGIILGFVFVVLLGFRGELLAIMVCTLYITIRIKGFSLRLLKYAAVFFFAVLFSTQIPIVQKQVDNMFERHSVGETFSNKDYVRYAQFDYFMNEHPINFSERIFGSGIPGYTSDYGKTWNKKTSLLTDVKGKTKLIPVYGWYDWGIVGLSWMVGIPIGVVLYVFIFYMIFKRYGKKYLFISTTYLFFLLTSITTIEFYRSGAYFYHAFILFFTTRLDAFLKR